MALVIGDKIRPSCDQVAVYPFQHLDGRPGEPAINPDEVPEDRYLTDQLQSHDTSGSMKGKPALADAVDQKPEYDSKITVCESRYKRRGTLLRLRLKKGQPDHILVNVIQPQSLVHYYPQPIGVELLPNVSCGHETGRKVFIYNAPTSDGGKNCSGVHTIISTRDRFFTVDAAGDDPQACVRQFPYPTPVGSSFSTTGQDTACYQQNLVENSCFVEPYPKLYTLWHLDYSQNLSQFYGCQEVAKNGNITHEVWTTWDYDEYLYWAHEPWETIIETNANGDFSEENTVYEPEPFPAPS